MAQDLDFDPSNIEKHVYNILDEAIKKDLANPKVINMMNFIRIKRASRILEDESKIFLVYLSQM